MGLKEPLRSEGWADPRTFAGIDLNLKPAFDHLEHGLTMLECRKCKRASYWSVAAMAFRPLKCWWCKAEIDAEDTR